MSQIEREHRFGWQETLFRELDTLRQAVAEQQDSLEAITQDDFSHLFGTYERLEKLLAAPGDINRHDLMNVLAAMRGYAEMLSEE